MAYKPPESKREGCHYPNCSGYLEVPFCCHDPESFPALKAKLAPPPKREWVGLTDETLDDVYFCVEGGTTPLETWREQARAIEAKLKEKNGGAI